MVSKNNHRHRRSSSLRLWSEQWRAHPRSLSGRANQVSVLPAAVRFNVHGLRVSQPPVEKIKLPRLPRHLLLVLHVSILCKL